MTRDIRNTRATHVIHEEVRNNAFSNTAITYGPQGSTWEHLPEGVEQGSEAISIAGNDHGVRSLDYVYGIGTQSIESGAHRYDSVHVYKDGHIDRLVLNGGEHKIWDGAYAAAVMANKDAVLYVNGHVGTLVVSATAQVIIGHGAYIDSMQIMKGGMARIEDDAAVCNLRVYNGGRCMINDEVRINRRQYDDGSIVGYLLSKPDKECPLYVSMAFHSLAAARNCSAAITEGYRASDDNVLRFADGWTIGSLHHCQLYLGTLSFYADYVSYNRKEEEPIKLYQALEHIYKQVLPDDEMSHLEVVLHGEPVDPNAVAVVRFLDEKEDEPVECDMVYAVEDEGMPVRMADFDTAVAADAVNPL